MCFSRLCACGCVCNCDGDVGLGLIVLKVGCRMSIPISAGVGLEGRVDEQMMGRTDGGEGERERK